MKRGTHAILGKLRSRLGRPALCVFMSECRSHAAALEC